MIIQTLFGEEIVESKVCNCCGIDKPLSEYAIRAHNKNGVPADRRNACKSCESMKGKSRRDLRKQVSPPPSNHTCPICCRNEEEISSLATNRRTWVLDHDHKTNKFRGWICDPCNVALGRFDDDPIRLKRAIEYLNDKI